VAEAEGEATRLRAAVEAAQADADESARMADLLSGALTETRERARRHLLHVERLLAIQERLLRERRELGTLRERERREGEGGEGAA
jgi:hypothetical protein